ncbi:MAG: transporter substrate-binding domain-containing protein [Spirochaetales bacterium]|nr:transporter substrate-binding domain-containing protein [Spirochaetales bacterium]
MIYFDIESLFTIIKKRVRRFSPVKRWTFLLILFSIINVFQIASEDEGGLLRIASEPDYPPFCIVDENGEADGFSVELFKEAAKVMGLNAEIKVGTWNDIKEELSEGRIDALPMVGRSPEREEYYDFTFPYHTMHGAVFVRKGTDGIKSIEDLENKTILVMKGDNAEEYVNRVNLSPHIVTTENYFEAFELLSSGQYDAVIAQRLMGIQLLNIMDIENIIPLAIELDGFSQDLSFAVRKGNSRLLSTLNEGLAIIIADGTYDRIHSKWFTPDLLPRVSLKDIIVRTMYFIIPFMIILVFSALIMLRIQVHRKTLGLNQEIIERKHIEEELNQQLSEKLVILKEVHHRIKNNYAAVESLLSMQSESIENEEASSALQDAIGRVRSMRILYEKMLLTDEYNVTSTSEYLNNLISEIRGLFSEHKNIKLKKSIDDFQLEQQQLLLIGFIVNELLTNIMKYAFAEGASGSILIEFTKNSNAVTLKIQDDGNGLPEDFDINSLDSFGLSLVKTLSSQLNGTFTITSDEGVKARLEFLI